VKSILLAGASAAVLFGAAGAASADPMTVFGYNLTASIRAEVAPSYEGGKHMSVFPGGSLAITKPWAYDDYAAPDDAASFGLFNTRRFSFGIAASLRENRGNDDELEGMRNIGWSLQGGGFMNVWPTSWMRLHVEGLKGVTAQSGLLVNTGADIVSHTGRWMIAGGPRYSWGDDKFNGTYFGVTPAEALASSRIDTPFLARAGSHFAGLEVNAEYKLYRRWRLTFDASYHHLLGDDANSPLVRQIGNPEQFGAAIGARFALNK
jgi:outer membrane protein